MEDMAKDKDESYIPTTYAGMGFDVELSQTAYKR
jgi:hypothetical protein